MKYDMRKEYNLTDLSPASWYQASLNILQDETAAIAYRTRRFTDGPGPKGTTKTEPCDGKCRQRYYCETSSSEYQSWYTCMNQKYEDLGHEQKHQMMLGATKGQVNPGTDIVDLVKYENVINHDWYRPRNKTLEAE